MTPRTSKTCLFTKSKRKELLLFDLFIGKWAYGNLKVSAILQTIITVQYFHTPRKQCCCTKLIKDRKYKRLDSGNIQISSLILGSHHILDGDAEEVI